MRTYAIGDTVFGSWRLTRLLGEGSYGRVYQAERDVENTGDSVFCEHGAGVTVKWDHVPARAHIPPFRRGGQREEGTRLTYGGAVRSASEQELEDIFVRTYGPIRNRGMDALRQRSRAPVTVPVPMIRIPLVSR